MVSTVLYLKRIKGVLQLLFCWESCGGNLLVSQTDYDSAGMLLKREKKKKMEDTRK